MRLAVRLAHNQFGATPFLAGQAGPYCLARVAFGNVGQSGEFGSSQKLHGASYLPTGRPEARKTLSLSAFAFGKSFFPVKAPCAYDQSTPFFWHHE
jgi:hypothetical protein